MSPLPISGLLLVALLLRPAAAQAPPPTPKQEVVDTYFGVAVADPYRWMEPPVPQNPDFRRWLEDQNAYTRQVLDALPERAALRARLAELADIVTAVPEVRPAEDRWFYLKLQPGEQTAKLYVRDARAGRDRMLLDPTRLPPRTAGTGPSTTSCRPQTAGWWVMAPRSADRRRPPSI